MADDKAKADDKPAADNAAPAVEARQSLADQLSEHGQKEDAPIPGPGMSLADVKAAEARKADKSSKSSK